MGISDANFISWQIIVETWKIIKGKKNCGSITDLQEGPIQVVIKVKYPNNLHVQVLRGYWLGNPIESITISQRRTKTSSVIEILQQCELKDSKNR